jgi:GR25 family glycosyltransferase involved in LPS biosynthesis
MIPRIPIFWLNLERRKDKREWFENTNRFSGVSFTRIPAIDPELFKVSSTERAETNGHLACWLSHYMILNMIVNSGYHGAIVLEDDAKLVEDFPVHLPILHSIENFVHLGGLQSKNWGTWGYYVSRCMASKIVDKLRLGRTDHIDWQLYKMREELGFVRYPVALASHIDIGLSDTTGDHNPRLDTIYSKEVAV